MSFDGNTLTDYRYPTLVVIRDETKTNAGRRTRPIGVNRLFDGTNVVSSRETITPGVLTQRFTAPYSPRTWSQTTELVFAGHLGPGYPANIPDKYWTNKLRTQLRDSSINLAQSFAERRQVEGMFTDYGRRLVKAYSSLRKGNVSGVFNALLGTGNRPPKGWKRTIRDTTGVASDSWLAWQYGVRPLISDLQGAVEEYWKVRAVAPVIRRYKLGASNDERAGATLVTASPPQTITTTATQKASIVCYAEFQDSAQAWDQSADRLGLTNPALLAWELIPYSFVIDWFINVGEFLEASGSFTGLERLGIHVTTETIYESVRSLHGVAGRTRLTVKSRMFTNILPDAVISIRSNPLSVSHVTSGLALIRQLR